MTAAGQSPVSRSPTTGNGVMSAMGLGMRPPRGFDISIYRRPAEAGEHTYPVLHAATIALPANRGDYGAGVVEALGADDVFVSLLEFGPDSVGTALFRTVTGIPGLTPSSYRPAQLQRSIRSQAGVQKFFTLTGRAFCLYSVIGSLTNRIGLTNRANQVLSALTIEPS
jgi:hypothetical protein